MFTLSGDTFLSAVFAFLLGIALGWLIWGRSLNRNQRIAFELAQSQTSVEDAAANRLRLERELAASRDQVKPLADEVDRLRRDLARAERAPLAAPVLDGTPRDLPSSRDTTPIEAPMPATGDLGDLRLLKGVGDKLASRLLAVGVPDTQTLAALSPAEASRVDSELGPFAGRIERDQLIDQARLLADGRVTEFEARYGKLERPA